MKLIAKPSKENIKTYVPIGLSLVFLSFFDVFANAFFNYNLMTFLPSQLSYFLPLLLGFVGFYLIRIEFSGVRSLDLLNKNINSNNFNAFLTLLTVFIIIKSIPPLLNWFVLEANFVGDSKDDCTGNGACWVFIKVWFNRFMYGLYPDAEQWRINTAFLILFAVVGISFFVKEKLKKYFIILSAPNLPLLPSAIVHRLAHAPELVAIFFTYQLFVELGGAHSMRDIAVTNEYVSHEGDGSDSSVVTGAVGGGADKSASYSYQAGSSYQTEALSSDNPSYRDI